ncbi:hypothetical protein GOP47_0021405 [Adiantum capillus-veneris]|uniref:Uncharacterized protein n=1 Tax=Adiantum capillus-veneris TaxID=13818 RepID=A0A9D4Z569_ADICA|nr:hypothetical protein GOP47_0021405 [Adiantum capillus-veneris]
MRRVTCKERRPPSAKDDESRELRSSQRESPLPMEIRPQCRAEPDSLGWGLESVLLKRRGDLHVKSRPTAQGEGSSPTLDKGRECSRGSRQAGAWKKGGRFFVFVEDHRVGQLHKERGRHLHRIKAGSAVEEAARQEHGRKVGGSSSSSKIIEKDGNSYAPKHLYYGFHHC